MTATAARTPVRPLRRVLTAALLLGVLSFAVLVGYWVASGGRWYVVRTPSMGTAAPVGTLLWVKPVAAHDLHVGELISFRPPNSSEVYSHRIHVIHPDGTITTKGQITSPDPWRIRPANIVGAVQMRWWGVGWLVRAAPILLLGGLAVWFVAARVVAARWRLPTVMLGGSVLVSACILVYRPLSGAVSLSLEPTGKGGRASFVSTGLLPLRLQARGGGHVDIRTGQVGSVLARQADSKGSFPVSLHPHVPLLFWVVLVAVCLVPAVWTTFFGTSSGVHHTPRHSAA